MGVKALIKAIMDEKGWTAHKLARESGVSKQMISHWTRYGASSVAIRHLIALKHASGFSWSRIGEILSDEVDKKA
jgi:transcriptional regulator with XRE-family HTH domain